MAPKKLKITLTFLAATANIIAKTIRTSDTPTPLRPVVRSSSAAFAAICSEMANGSLTKSMKYPNPPFTVRPAIPETTKMAPLISIARRLTSFILAGDRSSSSAYSGKTLAWALKLNARFESADRNEIPVGPAR